MAHRKIREEPGVRKAREAYFAGEITAEEYLRRALAQSGGTGAREIGPQSPEVRRPQAARSHGSGSVEVQFRDVRAHQQEPGEKVRSPTSRARMIGRLWRMLNRLPEAERRRA